MAKPGAFEGAERSATCGLKWPPRALEIEAPMVSPMEVSEIFCTGFQGFLLVLLQQTSLRILEKYRTVVILLGFYWLLLPTTGALEVFIEVDWRYSVCCWKVHSFQKLAMYKVTVDALKTGRNARPELGGRPGKVPGGTYKSTKPCRWATVWGPFLGVTEMVRVMNQDTDH